MLKKILIISLAALMLFGCKKDNGEKPEVTTSASPTVSADVSSEASASPQASGDIENNEDEKKEEDKKTEETKAPLEVPEVDSAKKDPERTASVPETPKPDKIINNPSSDKSAGSGSRATEVSEETITANSADNAVKLAMQYLKQNDIYIPKYIEVEREDDNFYYVHAYEKITDSAGVENVASVGWYNVSKKDSSVTKGQEDIKIGERPETYTQ